MIKVAPASPPASDDPKRSQNPQSQAARDVNQFGTRAIMHLMALVAL
jgi:hypothetical protein